MDRNMKVFHPGKKEKEKTKKSKKKKTGGKRSKGRKDRKEVDKYGGEQCGGSKKRGKKQGKERSSQEVRRRHSVGARAPIKDVASDKPSKKHSKQRKNSKDQQSGKQGKDHQQKDSSDKKQPRDKKIGDSDRKTSIKPSTSDNKHWVLEEFVEPGKQKSQKEEKPKLDSPSVPQAHPPIAGAKDKELKTPVVEPKDVASKPIAPKPQGPEPQLFKSSLTYPPPSPPRKEPKPASQKLSMPPQPKKEVYGVRPEKPDLIPITSAKPVSPTLQATQREDIVLSDEMKTAVLMSPPKEAMAPQLSRQPVCQFDAVQTPQPSPEPRPSFLSAFPSAPTTKSAQQPPSSSLKVEVPPPSQSLKALPPPSVPLQQAVSGNLRVNIDEILRLGAIMERRGLSTDKKMSFEWIALNRHVIHQQPEAFAAHLVTAVGDVRLEKSLACDALNVLMYQRTISPDEYLRLCQQLDSSPQISIGILAQLLRTNTQFYSSPRNTHLY
uniref:SH3 domain-containing protein n=1 Tax=Angiostrongylus cantonensis TaxID=6313 RepID=A0A0K0DNG8_ANGCA